MTEQNKDDLWSLVEHSVKYTGKKESEAPAPQKEEETSEAQETKSWIKNAEKKKKEAYAKINNTAKALFTDPLKLQDYLVVQANFNRYSVRNSLLVTAQMPSATKLHSFTEWRQAGYNVKKGATGVIVLEPGNEYTRRDGSAGRYMNIRTLFDISQVVGEMPKSNKLDPQDEKRLKLSGLIYNLNDMIRIVDISNNPNLMFERPALYNDGIIYVDKERAEFSLLYPALATEIAHSRCAIKYPEDYSRQGYGSICLFVAYMICVKHNVYWDYPLIIPDSYKELSVNDTVKILDIAKGIFNDINGNIEKGYKEQKKREK